MAVITISRESGSDGGQIARLLAARLGYHLVGEGVVQPLLQQYGVVDFEHVYDAAPGLSARFVNQRPEVTSMLNRVLLAVAQHGNAVILGRGGYAALHDVADVLNVRVQAPLPVRARRILERGQARSLAAAQDHAEERDKRRATFVKLSYGLAWDSTHEFDLVVDTGKLSAESACELIARAALAVWNPDAETRLGSELEVDPVLARAVSEALGCSSPHGDLTEETSPPAPS